MSKCTRTIIAGLIAAAAVLAAHFSVDDYNGWGQSFGRYVLMPSVLVHLLIHGAHGGSESNGVWSDILSALPSFFAFFGLVLAVMYRGRRKKPTPVVESQELVERRVTSLLQPDYPDLFRVIYDPAFPRGDGSTAPWFQVIIEVGPADEATARAQVHKRFVQLLATISPLPEAQHAQTVSLRARRHVPPNSPPDHPFMFIECAWQGATVVEMQRTQNFAAWHSYCYYYVNRHNKLDPLTRRESIP